MDCVYLENAKYLGGYKFHLRFNDGVEGVVNVKPVIVKYPQAKSLTNESEIAKFYLDSWPTLAWPSGFDIAPETLYEQCEQCEQSVSVDG